MESSLNNNSMFGNTSYIGLGESYSLLDINEDPELLSSQKKELEELIKNVPYSLSVALIKISQLHDYEPMDIDTLYQKILPAFPLLRRNDGSKYQSHSLHTVRSAMVSNKLYIKNPQGKYVLNVPNAIKIIKAIKTKKKTSTEKEKKPITYINSNKEEDIMDNNEPFINYESQNIDINNISNISNNSITNIPPSKQKKIKIKNNKENMPKNKTEKYEKTFLVLDNLLKTSESDTLLYSQLDLDLSNLGELSKLPESQLNADKMMGMLCVFKFFKPFLERSLNSVRCQENIMKKLIDLKNEVQNMENYYNIEE